MATGLQTIDGKEYIFFTPSDQEKDVEKVEGSLVQNSWYVLEDGRRVYVGENGEIQKNKYIVFGVNDWVFLNEDGVVTECTPNHKLQVDSRYPDENDESYLSVASVDDEEDDRKSFSSNSNSGNTNNGTSSGNSTIPNQPESSISPDDEEKNNENNSTPSQPENNNNSKKDEVSNNPNEPSPPNPITGPSIIPSGSAITLHYAVKDAVWKK